MSPPAPAPRQAEAPVRLVTPEQAVTQAVQVAAPRQAGLAPLFADIAQLVQAGDDTQAPVPVSVSAAAADVLSFRVPLDAQLTAADVKQAFVRSGILFEPKLVAARTDIRPAPTPGDDLKAALLVFRQVLKTWALIPQAAASSDAAPLSPEQATGLARTLATALVAREAPHAASLGAIAPPYRGAPLAVQAPVAPSIAPDATTYEIADKLVAETDGALARQTLLQVASLTEQPDQPRAEAPQRWSFEVPFATPQGTAIAQFEVSRDGRTPKTDPQARTWRARFSLDVEPMGPVHAMIALNGARTSVTLWAERATTATRLNEHAPRLREALHAAQLEPADFQARVGAPPAARQTALGRFMDRAS